MSSKTAEIEIQLTAGAIKNGYLRLPEELLVHPGSRKGEETVLELAGMGPVDGSIDETRRMFRWRGWKKFFQLHGLRAGDRITIRTSGPGHYYVSPIPGGLFAQPDANETNGVGLVAKEPYSKPRVPKRKRCNDLDGTTWLQYSLSVWSDIRKTAEEVQFGHPAMFPAALPERLIRIFMGSKDRVVLDPFVGSGSTLVAAVAAGKRGIGFDISPEYVELAGRRLSQRRLTDDNAGSFELRLGDARKLLLDLERNSVDLCVTSPPYWNILNQRRSADAKAVRHYGNLPDDLGTIDGYEEFLASLAELFTHVLAALRPGAFCCVVVMDLRKQDRFYPLHADLARDLVANGFELDDIIIWNRAHEYNNLRPLGYPARFRVNKIHEFVLIFRKPDAG